MQDLRWMDIYTLKVETKAVLVQSVGKSHEVCFQGTMIMRLGKAGVRHSLQRGKIIGPSNVYLLHAQ